MGSLVSWSAGMYESPLYSCVPFIFLCPLFVLVSPSFFFGTCLVRHMVHMTPAHMSTSNPVKPRRPLTGRSHQIRAHLAHAGHPIANDAPYGGPYPGPIVFGPRPSGDAPPPMVPAASPTGMHAIRHDGPVDEHCPYCPWLVPHDWSLDLQPLWLHALSYAGPSWRFSCGPPAWAAPGGVGELEEAGKGVKRRRAAESVEAGQ